MMFEHSSRFNREECEAQVKGHPGAVFKGFSTRSEASAFVQGGRGGGGGYGSYARSYSSHQPAAYPSTSFQPSYSTKARQRYCGNFTSNRR